MNRWFRAPTWLGVLLVTVTSSSALADSGELRDRAQAIVGAVESSLPTYARATGEAGRKQSSAVERIAAGEILLRNKDWDRAIDLLNQVLELYQQGKASEAARADAEFMVAEAYLGSEQYLSARRHYLAVLSRAPTEPYGSYAGRSVSRIVDISLRLSDESGLDQVIARLEQLPSSDATGSLQYARAKAYFARGDFAKAREAIASVAATSPYIHQATYLEGAILTKEALASASIPSGSESASSSTTASAPSIKPFAAALEQFRAVTHLPPDTAEHRHVIDLAWMAIGRIYYHTQGLLDAAAAYSHVGRQSPEFSTALYEVAWVYARIGDYQRAQRALEVLSITDPQSLQLADGSLLRADLMLRSGQFDKALNLYESVRSRFEPAQKQVDSFLKANADPSVYYDRIVADSLERPAGTGLPALAVDWAREQAQDDHTFVVIDDISRSRDLVRRSRRLVSQLIAAYGSPTRVQAFPGLKTSMEETLGALNRVSEARMLLAQGVDELARADVPGDLARVRSERRALMKQVAQLPTSPGDFARRESAGESQWNSVSQELQRLTLEVDKLRAIVNALSRVMRDSDQYGVTVDPASRERFRAEIQANERDMSGYTERIARYRESVEAGRVQIGLGDARYVDDQKVRDQFRRLFEQEISKVTAGQDDPDATAYAREIGGLLRQMAPLEAKLEAMVRGIDGTSRQRAQELLAQVAKESSRIEVDAQQLDALDQQARLLVGEVAMRNFEQVRDRLKSIVLRADVGIVQQAWELREEQRTRVLNLQRERAREEQDLNDELREVLDDAEGAL